MKNIQPRLVKLFKEGYCTPQIGRIARAIDEPSTTIHYNIKKLEKEGVIKTYKAVFDYKKINEGFCVYVLISLASKQYSDPENIARTLARQKEVESVDILTGDWELIVKVRVGSQDEYYDFLKKVIAKQEGIRKTKSMISLRYLKTEFVSFP
ncbi:Lrp/AsnC family transcriptional regulator [Candidatus Bathyarchaeota archaeon]|jgi:Lrp/AsnC family transcriptional regulator|nr:Lrp/AsnC family transcriptional regulator [Candidatus Bathyarchaeota archaeon]